MGSTPVLIVTDDPVDRVMEKVQQLATLRPALLRLLEWQIDQELERADQRTIAHHERLCSFSVKPISACRARLNLSISWQIHMVGVQRIRLETVRTRPSCAGRRFLPCCPITAIRFGAPTGAR